MSKNFEIIYKEFMNSETFVVSRELLEDYKRQAAQEERERIIKLINDIAAPYGEDAQIAVIFVIALIMGENK
jgi:hypothetical protein